MNWIKVTDRVPDDDLDNDQVIVSLTYDSFEPTIICALWKNENFYSLETGEFFDNVTHWMPLPEPPKD